MASSHSAVSIGVEASATKYIRPFAGKIDERENPTASGSMDRHR